MFSQNKRGANGNIPYSLPQPNIVHPSQVPLISTLATAYPNAVSHTAAAPNALLPGTCPLHRFIKKAKARHRPMFYTKENPRNKAKQRPSVLGYLLSCFINSAILPRRSIEYTPLSFSKYSKRLKAFCNSVSLSCADASV